MTAMLMRHAIDPADALWKKLGDISDIAVMHNQVLLAVYDRPKETAAGVHLPDQYLREEEYQGKAALVVKCGPTALQDSGDWNFSATPIGVGDWVVIRASDGWNIKVRGVLCRLVPDTLIRMRVPSPDAVY